jgi:hypothetical protein
VSLLRAVRIHGGVLRAAEGSIRIAGGVVRVAGGSVRKAVGLFILL